MFFSQKSFKIKLDEFTLGYIYCALWNTEVAPGVTLDEFFSIENMKNETLQAIKTDCETFQEKHKDILEEYYKTKRKDSFPNYGPEHAGYDFWIYRNHLEHLGFDRKDILQEVQDKMKNACKEFPPIHISQDRKMNIIMDTKPAVKKRKAKV